MIRKIKQARAAIKERGLEYIFMRSIGAQAYIPQPAAISYRLLRKLFKGKTGIEVGGPSSLFGKQANYLPVYSMAKSIDNCNFSGNTIWEGTISSGQTFHYDENKTGTQYIADATEIERIPKRNYDFLLSSNCLEHVANPLKALHGWRAILKPRGVMLLVLPNKKYSFDHNRAVTTFEHLLEDFKNNTGEDDLTHLDEILKLHDLSMDLPAGTPEQFKARSLKNFENRALHQHVFDIPLLKQLMEYMDMDVLHTYEDNMHVITGRKRG